MGSGGVAEKNPTDNDENCDYPEDSLIKEHYRKPLPGLVATKAESKWL